VLGTPEAIPQLSARALRQSVERQRGAHQVGHQALELIPPAGRHDNVSMETEPLEPGRAPPGRRGGGSVHASDPMTGVRPAAR
jgi:hypothetical protein